MVRLTPHQKIMKAQKRGTGLRLTLEDVEILGMDSAIADRAALDDHPESKNSD